jgi:hypothetical protein
MHINLETKTRKQGININTIGYTLCFISLLLFSIPKAKHPALLFPVGGIDLSLIPLATGVFLYTSTRKIIKWNKDIPIYFCLIPLIMLISNLLAYTLTGNEDNLLRGTLQAFRRISPMLFIILLCQISFSKNKLHNIFKASIYLTLVSIVLFYLLLLGFFENFEIVTDLSGNNLLSNLMNITKSSAGESFRLSGNTGSPTTFGLICSIQSILIFDLYLRGKVSNIFFFFCSSVLFIALISTAAKAAIFSTFLSFFILILFYFTKRDELRENKNISISRIKNLFFFVLFTFTISVVVFLYFDFIEDLSLRADLSGTTRIDKYLDAIKILSKSPIVMFFGEGWRSREIGWHSEIFELIMGYGLPLGLICISIQYIYLPLKILSFNGHDLYFSKFSFFISYLLILANSLIQDLFHDAYIMYIFFLYYYIFASSKKYNKCTESSKLEY